MSVVVAHPVWQPSAPAAARPGGHGSSTGRRGSLQLVGPGFVPPASSEPAGAPFPGAAVGARSGRHRVQSRNASARLRLTVRGRRVVAALVVLLGTALSVGLGALVGIAANPSGAAATTSVTVGPGETLWSLAATVSAPGEDRREIVEEIAALNGLASPDLAVGQELLLPAGR